MMPILAAIVAVFIGALISNLLAGLLRIRRWKRHGPMAHEVKHALVCLKYTMHHAKTNIVALTIHATGRMDVLFDHDAPPKKSHARTTQGD